MGIYFAFKIDGHVLPNRIMEAKSIESNYLLSYKFYSDMLLFLSMRPEESAKKSIVPDNKSSGTLYFDLASRQSLNSEPADAFDYNDLDEFAELEVQIDSQTSNEANSESNSKLDLYLDEIIELSVRDFMMAWLKQLIWDQDKFSTIAV